MYRRGFALPACMHIACIHVHAGCMHAHACMDLEQHWGFGRLLYSSSGSHFLWLRGGESQWGLRLRLLLLGYFLD